MAKDYYEILGVAKTATKNEIRKSYRKLARKWHPDINPGNKDAEQRFKEISQAYDVLGDDEKRKLYDEFGEEALRAGFDAEQARKYKEWGAFRQGTRAQWGGTAEGFGKYQSYEDIFGDLFGMGGTQEGFRTPRTSRGRDIEHDLSIDLISALNGFETELSMQKGQACASCQGSGIDPSAGMSRCSTCGGSGRVNVAQGPMHFTKPCPQCHGHGQTGKACSRCGGSGQVLGTERIRVTIPKGIKEGSKVRVAGKGEPGFNGGPAGDLYLVVHIEPHPLLRREGDNLYMDVPVTIYEAMGGATITIPSIDGPVRVKVPPKSQTGQTLRLKGKGAVNPKTKQRGDLMVKLSVKVPQTDDAEILKAAGELERLYKGDVRGDLRL